MLEGLQAAYHPYVRDRGLDWEIHIEEVSISSPQAMPSQVLAVPQPAALYQLLEHMQ